MYQYTCTCNISVPILLSFFFKQPLGFKIHGYFQGYMYIQLLGYMVNVHRLYTCGAYTYSIHLRLLWNSGSTLSMSSSEIGRPKSC